MAQQARAFTENPLGFQHPFLPEEKTRLCAPARGLLMDTPVLDASNSGIIHLFLCIGHGYILLAAFWCRKQARSKLGGRELPRADSR